jgi:hypothetical protein
VRSQHELEELARQLVVLLVRLAHVDRDRARLELRDEVHELSLLRCFAGASLLARSSVQQSADAEADERVGQQAGPEQSQG